MDTEPQDLPAAGIQPPVVVEADREERIEQLEKAIEKAKMAFEDAGITIFYNQIVWSFACLVVLVFSYVFAYELYHTNHKLIPENWMQFTFYATTRIFIITAIFSIASYCFKMLSCFISMKQHNNHKIAVLKSFATFVESGVNPSQRTTIFENLINIVVLFNESGLKDGSLKTQDVISNILSAVKKEE